MRAKPFILMILDGWGYREAAPDNAISSANIPVWNRLWAENPHLLLSASNEDVGLPHGQMGNSEVGHMNIGAGRIVYQDFTRIEKDIREGKFADNPAFSQLFKKLVAEQKTLHVMGLLSKGGVHSHERHIYALLDAAKNAGVQSIKVHAFLDGRDVAPKSAKESLIALENKLQEIGVGNIATVMGRYYAMDRDSRWDRVQLAYDAIANAKGPRATSALNALEEAYQQDKTDEFIKPTIVDPNYQGVAPMDGMIFANFRADRARELSHAFIDPDFKGFSRERIALTAFVTMTQYASDIKSDIAYPPYNLSPVLGEVWASNGLTQLRLAETEKYAHVTFFINGGAETPFPGEERILIPSPRVATYDLKPQMSAIEVTDALVNAITAQKFDAIIVNFANPDMVGHTGDLNAAIKAVETIDNCLGRITEALAQVGGECIITADHGNVEQMFDTETNQPHTAHTLDLVPLIYIGHPVKVLHEQGILADIAPTILHLMDLPIPKEMTGRILLK
ncbi:MAG: 2,3-bisphosphoglycerate-independent phosphoglycerate mutase [Gammaproteobacteria bacterium]|jgi:2,3-bisphosphoglycerate-independent phosphoglycerate mutase